MPNYWPKNMSHTLLTVEEIEGIRLNERLRQMEERIKALEDKQK